MANTTNFGWETPDDTDLVKDGASAIRTLGSAIDTSLVDLKGGTTGQVLSKASNTDLDYSWTTPITGLTELASGTLSGTSVILNSISGSYKNLQLLIRSVTWTSSNSYLTLKVNSITSGYDIAFVLTYADVGYTGGRNDENAWLIAPDNPQVYNNDQNAYFFEIYDYSSSSDSKVGICSFSHQAAVGDVYHSGGISVEGIDAAITSITISNNASNTFNGGTYILYGVK